MQCRRMDVDSRPKVIALCAIFQLVGKTLFVAKEPYPVATVSEALPELRHTQKRTKLERIVDIEVGLEHPATSSPNKTDDSIHLLVSVPHQTASPTISGSMVSALTRVNLPEGESSSRAWQSPATDSTGLSAPPSSSFAVHSYSSLSIPHA